MPVLDIKKFGEEYDKANGGGEEEMSVIKIHESFVDDMQKILYQRLYQSLSGLHRLKMH
ncbi:MAG: hypothetical protein K6G55_01535 [Selenomonadaceae bacterium]|nr:hypothetical protein [Selenomonadaceae bacterium]